MLNLFLTNRVKSERYFMLHKCLSISWLLEFLKYTLYSCFTCTIHYKWNHISLAIYRNVFHASHNFHLHFSNSFDVSFYLEITKPCFIPKNIIVQYILGTSYIIFAFPKKLLYKWLIYFSIILFWIKYSNSADVYWSSKAFYFDE